MADVSVDATISSATARAGRCLVFPTADIGYVFYIDSDGVFGYSKTTDGGGTWGAQVNVDNTAATTGIAFDVWFDQWTPGDAGTLIHCWFFDVTTDDIFYRTLDTNGDVLGTQRTAIALTSAVAGRGAFVSGTKTRSGYLYCCYDIDAGAEKGLIRSTDGGTVWSASLASTFLEATLDTCKLFPASGTGDNNDCWSIYYDASATALTIKMWDSSAVAQVESSTFQTHTDGATDLTGQFGYDGSVRHSDGHLIVAAVSLRDNASSQHQVFDVTSTSSIATKTNITTNIDDHYYPQVFINQSTGTIFVSYVGKRDGLETLDTAAKVYYTYSVDGGTTWNAGDAAYQEGAATTVQQVWSPLSGSRFYLVWRAATSTLVGNKVNSLIQVLAQGTTITSGSAVYEPTVAPGDVGVTTDFIAVGSVANEPTVSSVGVDQGVTGETLASTSSIFEPSTLQVTTYQFGRTSIGEGERPLATIAKGLRVSISANLLTGTCSIFAHLTNAGAAGAEFRAFVIQNSGLLDTVIAQSSIRTDIGGAGWYEFTGGTLASYAPTTGTTVILIVGTMSVSGATFSNDDIGLEGYSAQDFISDLDPLTWGSPTGLTPDLLRDYSIYLEGDAATGADQGVTTEPVATTAQVFAPVVTSQTSGATIGVGSAANAPTTVAPGAVTITGATLAVASAVNEPSILPGAVTITTASQASTSQAFEPSVVGERAVTTDTLASTSQVFAATILPGAVTVIGSSQASTQQMFAPVLTALAEGATIVSGSGTFAPTVTQTVVAGTVTATSQAQGPTVAPPIAQVTTATQASTSQVTAPSVAAGAVTITGVTCPTTAQVFAMTVVGAGSIALDTLSSASQVFAPVVTPAPSAVTGFTVVSTAQLFMPTVDPGAVTVTAATIDSTVQLIAPSLSTAEDVDLGAWTISATSEVFEPFVVLHISGLTISSTAQLFAPEVEPEVGIIVVGGLGPDGQVFSPTIGNAPLTGGAESDSTTVRYLVRARSLRNRVLVVSGAEEPLVVTPVMPQQQAAPKRIVPGARTLVTADVVERKRR